MNDLICINQRPEPDLPITIRFKFPELINGCFYHEIKARRPKVKDHLQAEEKRRGQDDFKKEMIFFSIWLGITLTDLKKMDLVNYMKIREAYNEILTGDQDD